jgi:MbtH protein
MTQDDQDDMRIHLVVINDEEQYSIWPSDKRIPDGWRAVGKQGRKAECLQFIEEVWTDMRPASLRNRMAANAELAARPTTNGSTQQT